MLIYRKQKKLSSFNEKSIKVDSAFGGIGIYKTNKNNIDSYPIQTIFIMMNVNMFFLIKTFQTNILIKIGKSFHLVSILNITTTDCQKRFYTY